MNKPADSGEKLIGTNPAAYQNYAITEVVEAGIVLLGTEIKSLRDAAPNLRDSFVEVNRQSGKIEAWLVNANLAHYSHGNIWNHETTRKRKLLLHRHQIERLFGASTTEGLTIIPTRLYFKKGRAKVELGIGRGKKKFDKRESLKSKSAEREMAQARKRTARDDD
jgi:SsrA-binding protein